MADQPSIFGTNTSTQTQETQTPANSNTQGVQDNSKTADLLASIRNERGEQKYATLEDALIGLQNAQTYIPQVKAQLTQQEQEIERLRKESERMRTLEETVAALTTQRQEQTSPPANTSPVFDESKLATLVEQTLTRKEQEALAASNLGVVTSTLQSVFGTDAEKKFYDSGAELGMSKQEMNALAAKSPKAVFKMLGINSSSAPKQTTVTSSSVNTSAFEPQNNTFVGRNPKSALIGATSQDLQESQKRANAMVEELHAKGMSVHDLTDPKVYRKYFKQ